MNEVPRVRSAPVESGERAAAQAPVDASGESTADRRAFDDALDEGGELHPQQTGETRTAIKRSLNRLEGSVANNPSQATRPDLSAGSHEMPRSGTERRHDQVSLETSAMTAPTDLRAEDAPNPGAPRMSGRQTGGPVPGAETREQPVPNHGTSRRSGRQDAPEPSAGTREYPIRERSLRPVPGAATQRDGSPVRGLSDPRIRPSTGETTAGPMGRAVDRIGRDAVADRPESPVAGRPASQGAMVPQDAEALPSTRVSVQAAPAGGDRPNTAATDELRGSRQEGPVPTSTRGSGTGRTPPERVMSGGAAATTGPPMREDGSSAGVAERSMPAGTMHSRNIAGPGGDEPLRDDPEVDEAATGAAENEAPADGPDANLMRGAGLEGLAPPGQRTAAIESGAPEAVQSSAQEIGQVAGQIADRILVSVPAPGASEEVRITLAESVLEGSDIRISREAGEIRIVFVAQTESAQRLLADNRGIFEQILGERLGDERVHVAVEGPEGGDTTRGEGDSRSRQQYVPQEDAHQDGIEP